MRMYFPIIIIFWIFTGCDSKRNYPNPYNNPESPLMLSGKWFEHPHKIDTDKLPRLSKEHAVISNVTSEGGVNQHNYIIHHNNRFWVMWSDGPGVEDRVGQVVKYATSKDGLNWSEPILLTGYPSNSGPESTHYNTRTVEGYRWIARGFWVYKGDLLALASLDEAAGFFGPSLELHSFKWNDESGSWEDGGVILDNAINNFPPKKLPSGEWMMSRRSFDYSERGVDFMVGGVESLHQWETFPVLGTSSELAAEEPFWWVLPDEKSMMALFRDNRRSGYLYRSFSTDNGRTWSIPVQTNFPDARSKFHGIQLQDGRFALVSNSHPKHRNYLTLALSNDGLVFDKMYYLVDRMVEPNKGVDYPHMMEHDGYLYIVHSGGKGGRKQCVELERVKIKDLK